MRARTLGPNTMAAFFLQSRQNRENAVRPTNGHCGEKKLVNDMDPFFMHALGFNLDTCIARPLAKIWNTLIVYLVI